jgi:hypothetical protein
MLYSGAEPESYITEYTQVYEDNAERDSFRQTVLRFALDRTLKRIGCLSLTSPLWERGDNLGMSTCHAISGPL